MWKISVPARCTDSEISGNEYYNDTLSKKIVAYPGFSIYLAKWVHSSSTKCIRMKKSVLSQINYIHTCMYIAWNLNLGTSWHSRLFFLEHDTLMMVYFVNDKTIIHQSIPRYIVNVNCFNSTYIQIRKYSSPKNTA